MKRVLFASIAALTLCSGCLLDDEFWDDGYDSSYDSPSGDDCDCDDYFAAPPSQHFAQDLSPLSARPR